MNGWQRLALALSGILGISAVAVAYIVTIPANEDVTLVANVAIISAALTAIVSALSSALVDS